MNPEKQELFDRALAHIRQQGGPSSTASRKCLYRLDGRMCAAGIFIQEYEPGMEGRDWNLLVTHYPDLWRLDPVAVKNRFFVFRLQEEHDQSARRANSDKEFLLEFERRMHALARLNNLTYREVEE